MNQEKSERENKGRKTWDHPWSYRESFMVVMELLLLGLILQVLSAGRGAPVLSRPVNLLGGAVLVAGIILIHRFYRKRQVIRWLSSIPAAVSAISFFAFVVLLLGFIPQDDPDAHRIIRLMGLSQIKQSWLMMISGIYFLASLGFVALRRALPLRRKNLGFLLNHAGLWITIAAGYLGTGDLLRLNLTVAEDHEPNSIAVNQRTGTGYELPFSVELIDFRIDDYNPRIGIMDARTGLLTEDRGTSLVMIETGMHTVLADWDIGVVRFEPAAFRKDSVYYPSDSTGGAPAALIRVADPKTGKVSEGWISCGSFMVMHQYLPLDGHRYLVMAQPEPRKYASDIIIHNGNGKNDPVTIEVNRPFRYSGWKLYQISYDEQMGRWSRTSVIELVKDPWLPVVYTGIFMLLAGALYLFWIGREIKDA